MKRLSATLTDLIALAEEIIGRPTTVSHTHRNRLHALDVEIQHAVALPAEGRRTTSAAAVMAIALREALNAAGEQQRMPWTMLAGTSLPMLRAEAFIAFSNEREQGKS